MSRRELFRQTGRLAAGAGVAACLALLGLATWAAAAGADTYTAYIAKNGYPNLDAVVPMITATNTIGHQIFSGNSPAAVAITPDGHTAYVANAGGGTVRPIEIATNTTEPLIAVGSDPDGIAVTPDGKTAYVANFADDTVTPIDIATNTAGTPIPVGGGPSAVAVTPDGSTAYVTNAIDGTVTPIAVATGTPETPIAVGGNPRGIAITPDGATAYVATGQNVVPISLATGTRGPAIGHVGPAPQAIAITPDGGTAYVASCTARGGVTPVDLATNTPGTTIDAGQYSCAIAITPDGATAYVVNNRPIHGSVTPITIATDSVGSSILVGRHPDAIAITPVTRQLSTTSVSCSPPSILMGQSATCTATVRGIASGTAVSPTGIVEFVGYSNRSSRGGRNYGTFIGNPCVLSGTGGSASCHVTYTPAVVHKYGGVDVVQASFAGDSNDAWSAGATVLGATAAATTTSLGCVPGTVSIGVATTCTATVANVDPTAPFTPGGHVVFWTSATGILGANACRVTGSGASASCHVTYTPRTAGSDGQQVINAGYGGDLTHLQSLGQTTVQVTRRATSTAISCELTTLTAGQPTTCTATVTDLSPGIVTTPTGTVAFTDGSTGSFTGSPCTLSGTGGVASCQVTYTPSAGGQHNLTASYRGDSSHSPSQGRTSVTVT